MGDHRADIKIKFSMYGETRDADMWINWSPDDYHGVDQRVMDFFEQAAREMRAKAYDPLFEKPPEDPERKEYERLKAKFEGTS